MTMTSMSQIEQFSSDELTMLRQELRESGLDSFQCGAVLTSFLSNKGYGVSADQARVAITCIGLAEFTLPRLQQELEKLAFVM